MHGDAVTVEAYLAGLPEDRRQAMDAEGLVILEHLPRRLEEVTQ